MKKLYVKSELAFALVLIAAYCLFQSLAGPLDRLIGVDSSVSALFNVLMSAFLLDFIRRNGLTRRYGLCRSGLRARRFLWYIPLLIMVIYNLLSGVTINPPPVDTLCRVCSMLCVGFIEEVLFRGFLFRALAENSVKTAAVVSSLAFGLGHILNIFNGSGMGLAENLCQICVAVALGFLFVTITYRGGSLLPCIFTHSAINAASVFSNKSGLTGGRYVIFCLPLAVIAVAYTLLLNKTLPAKAEN